MNIFARIACFFQGHKRGVRISHGQQPGELTTFECPRCKATWTRKVRPATTTSTT